MMVAAEVISLEYIVLAGCCWWSSDVYKPRVCSGVATTLDWTGQTAQRMLSGFLDSGLPVPARLAY